MLASLTVQNFAIISNINIEFDKGLTILTGETGAGKSLIIDAIGLLFGNRASTSMIRSGCTKAIVEGVFMDCGSKVMDIIKKYNLDSLDEGVIVVRREINENGKSLIRVNGAVVTLNQLSEITYYLADIHTQLDTKKLFDVHNYVNFIDDTTSLEILDEYHNRLNLYKNNLKLYYDKKNQIEADAENLDYLKYQLNELNSASLVANELEEIENKIKELNNYEHIYKGLSSVKNAFSDNDIVGSLYLVKQNLAKLKDLSDSYQNIFETSENLYYELEALEEDVIAKCSNLEFDEKTLDKLNSRYSLIKELMRKHRKSFDELIEYQNELNERVNNFVDETISLGDFVLTGGETAVMVMSDAITRLLPGVITESSIEEESFSDGALEYPQYTLPYNYEGYTIPDILFSGNHTAIKKWRRKKSLLDTKKYRPDLFEKLALTKQDKKLLEEDECPKWEIDALEKGKKFIKKDKNERV